MKKNVLILLLFLPGIVCLAQSEVENGLPINDSLYQALPESNMLHSDDSNYGATPRTTYSLRAYCPTPVSQNQSISGLNWTIALTHSMTIQWAWENKWNARQIQSQAFSYAFLYDLLPKAAPNSCNLSRDWLHQTKHLLEDVGTVRIGDYNPQRIDCNNRPSEELLRQAHLYHVRSFDRLFEVSSNDDGLSKGEKLFRIKRCLERNHAVVVCLQVDEAFLQLRQEIWIPLANPKTYPIQSVVVIGYDETRGAFEIMGSQGTSWGKGGFAWVRYQDIIRAKYGFEMITKQPKPQENTLVHNQNPPSQSKPAPLPRPKPAPENPQEASTLTGQLILNEVVGYNQYKRVPLSYQQMGYFQPNKMYQVSSQFQLVSQQAQEGSYVYVFSVDPAGKAEIHYPYQWTADGPANYGLGVVSLSSVVPEAKSQVVIPKPHVTYNNQGKMTRTERALVKEVDGTDWLVVLYSDRRLDNELNKFVKQLSHHTGDFMSRFNQIFGKRLIESASIDYTTNRFRTSAHEGYIVPMIIKLDTN